MKQTFSSLLASISTTTLRWMPCVEARDAPHAMRNCHASLTEVSPALWCTNAVAFPRGGKATGQHSNSSGNRKAFAGWRCGMLPVPWLLDRRSIVPCLANDFHHPLCLSIFARAVLDVHETFKVCKTCRAFWDVPIIPCCESPDRSSGMPRLVVPRFFDAVGQ